ncbi:MAG: hypothetical protein ACREA0_19990, partial [bacterium]
MRWAKRAFAVVFFLAVAAVAFLMAIVVEDRLDTTLPPRATGVAFFLPLVGVLGYPLARVWWSPDVDRDWTTLGPAHRSRYWALLVRYGCVYLAWSTATIVILVSHDKNWLGVEVAMVL